MAIHFEYVNPTDNKKHPFTLRTSPYNVNWTYNINTATYDTYGGQVVQILSVNVDDLIIDGQIGREGPFGVRKNGRRTKEDPRWGGRIPSGGWITNDQNQQWNPTSSEFPGLYQMSTYFAEYFSASSQGGIPKDPGKFIQIPMTITYDAGPYPSAASKAEAFNQTQVRQWKAFPNNFPAFARSNEEFAPLWKLEFSVYQADPQIAHAAKNDAIKALSRIRGGIGWEAENPWIDPAANPKDPPGLVTKKLVSEFKNFLPKITEGDLKTMIWNGISMPAVIDDVPLNKVFETFGGDQGSTHQSNPTVPKTKK